MDSKEVISIVTDIICFFRSTNWDSKEELKVISLIPQLFSVSSRMDMGPFDDQIRALNAKMEFVSLAHRVWRLSETLDLERKLLSLISQIMFLVSSMDLDSESELISLTKQIISLFNSKPDSESVLVSLVTRAMRLGISVEPELELTQESELLSLISQLVSLIPVPELTSFIRQIISRFISFSWEPIQLISLCPQAEVELVQGKFQVFTEVEDEDEDVFRLRKAEKGECRLFSITFWRSTRKYHFQCERCNGENHEEYEKAPTEVRHPLHPKHSLQLVWNVQHRTTRECYCCDERLNQVFYCCLACNLAMNICCVEKQPLLSMHHLKWHEHALSLFPRHTTITCDLCALTDSSCPFYICPPCDFLVHQSCISLPRVIRISRHPHRISFTSSFDQGDWSCGVCRTKIENNYGGYSCIKAGCSYAAHSRCATQSNVWDGIDLEGVPEVIEEEVEPFVRISKGIIQHFSHEHHYLRLDENTGRDYDEDELCQACITPIYFGNLYSCMECEFILHEKCANLTRKIYHPIHPHKLTLVERCESVMDTLEDSCSACRRMCVSGFVYKCCKEECCQFKLNVQCATIFEPLVYGSHMHPLFLTSKPGEERKCWVCKCNEEVTFNCTECECDFALCFGCAIIPQKVRYKHDKHMLTLYYEEETAMEYWCEACEKNINPKKGFYKCDEYCCVTLHIRCVIGRELYMRPGSSLFYWGKKVDVLPNNQSMSRPFCSRCKKRCPQKVAFQSSELIFCSVDCVLGL